MVALTAANVTITVTQRRIFSKQRRHRCTITFGDGALTYPALGVPLPSKNSFGFARVLESMNIADPGSADGFIYKFDEANQVLRIYQGDNANASPAPAVELGAVAVAAKTLKVEAIGW